MITLYESTADDFTTLGMAVLSPTSCEIEEIAGGEFELTMQHPIDAAGKHRLLVPGRIIKAPAPVRENPEIIEPGSTPVTKTYQVWKSVASGRLFIRQTMNGAKIDALLTGEECLKMEEGTYSGSTWFKVQKVNGGAVGWVFPNLNGTPYLQNTGRSKTVTTGGDDPGTSVEVKLSRMQLFVIREVKRRSASRMVEVKAEHIFYRLRGSVWIGTSSAYDIPLSQLVQRLRDTTYVSHDAGIELKTFVSGVNWKVTSSQLGKNAMAILLDEKNGALAQAGGRLIRDNFNAYIIPKKDRDLGYELRYGKNLLDAEYTRKISDVVTRVVPLGKTAGGGPLWGTAQTSPHIHEYGENDKVIQYSVQAASESAADVAAARTQLNTLAQREFTRNHIDEPAAELTAEFANLGNTPLYTQIANEYSLHMYDTIHVMDRDAGINGFVTMKEYRYDCLNDRYNDTVFGDAVIVNDEHQIVYLTWLESDGTAWIDTGVKAHLGTEAKLDMIVRSSSHVNTMAMGDIANSSAALSVNLKISGTGTPTSRFGAKTVTMGGAIELGTRYLWTINKTAFVAKKVATGATTTVGSFGQTANFETQQTMYLFVGRTASGISTYTGTIRMYGCTISEDGTLIRDFRPALYDGVPCMFDTVTQTPCFNASGAGEFEYPLPNGSALTMLTGGRGTNGISADDALNILTGGN